MPEFPAYHDFGSLGKPSILLLEERVLVVGA